MNARVSPAPSAHVVRVFGRTLAAAVLGLTSLAAQPGPNQTGPGPWDQDISVYRVPREGEPQILATFERAGVATAARLADGRLAIAHQHFPAKAPADFDKVALHFSSDEGRTWTGPEVMRLRGLPEDMRFPFDPTLVPLPDGRVRMYFTSRRQGRDEVPAIYSAISGNAVDYTFEPGRRFGIARRGVIDCAVVLHRGEFHLFAPDNGTGHPADPGRDPRPAADQAREGTGYHAISQDGLVFERVADVQVPGRRRWLGDAKSDGERITFYGTGEGGLWVATSVDGKTWQPDRMIRGVRAADPGTVVLKDGAQLIAGTAPPRAGTPSAQRRPGPGGPPPPPRWSGHLTPLTELGSGTYKGERGGLYGDGRNTPPEAHGAAALKQAAEIRPLAPAGVAASDGKIGLLSVGMSNTTQEFSRFMQEARRDPQRSGHVVFVDGAQGGQTGVRWADETSPLWSQVEARVLQAGLTAAQIQVVWMKQAEAGPAQLGEYPRHAEVLRANLAATVRHLRARFPNLRIVYLSSRIYAGYAKSPLNPEPFAYESAFAVRKLMLEQITGDAALNFDAARGPVKAPLLLWGPYLWADGETPRSAGSLTYAPGDFGDDGTHPSESGRAKVARALLEFFKTDATTTAWFLAEKPAGSAPR